MMNIHSRFSTKTLCFSHFFTFEIFFHRSLTLRFLGLAITSNVTEFYPQTFSLFYLNVNRVQFDPHEITQIVFVLWIWYAALSHCVHLLHVGSVMLSIVWQFNCFAGCSFRSHSDVCKSYKSFEAYSNILSKNYKLLAHISVVCWSSSCLIDIYNSPSWPLAAHRNTYVWNLFGSTSRERCRLSTVWSTQTIKNIFIWFNSTSNHQLSCLWSINYSQL